VGNSDNDVVYGHSAAAFRFKQEQLQQPCRHAGSIGYAAALYCKLSCSVNNIYSTCQGEENTIWHAVQVQQPPHTHLDSFNEGLRQPLCLNSSVGQRVVVEEVSNLESSQQPPGTCMVMWQALFPFFTFYHYGGRHERMPPGLSQLQASCVDSGLLLPTGHSRYID
jgi:uncharacterized repeat protein (TIGR04076 family)